MATIRAAAKLFDEVERQHPYSVWARRAQLMSAFNYYLAEKYPDAISSARRFVTIHPGNAEAPYAQYLIAMSYYQQIPDVTRDQTTTQSASDAFGELIRRYPDTRYAADARLKLDLITDHLAGKEMEVGRFYERSGPMARRVLPLPFGGRQLPDVEPHARGARAAGRSQSRARPARRSAQVGGRARRQLPGQLLVQAVAASSSDRSSGTRGPLRASDARASAPHMLRQLAIHNVVLVDRLELEFEPGLGVLTGETGAGKSILLDALGLALGARADTGLVRAGQDGASVSAELELVRRPSGPCGARASRTSRAEAGEPLIIRRTLKSDGGSRAFVGGAAVPAGLLREVGALAVEIHGQQDDRGLLNPKGHRALLDTFGRLDTAASPRAWAEVTRDRRPSSAQARAEAAAAERDREWLEHASGEIESTGARGRRGDPARRRARGDAGRRSRRANRSTGLDALLGGSEGALALLRQAARRIERGAADHPLLGEALASLDRAVIEASEAEDRIARAADALAFDPARLEQVEARLFDIRALARKHRVEPDALAGAWRADARPARRDRCRRRAHRRARPRAGARRGKLFRRGEPA